MKTHKVVFTAFALAQLDALRGRLVKQVVDTAAMLESNPRMFELMDRYVREASIGDSSSRSIESSIE